MVENGCAVVIACLKTKSFQVFLGDEYQKKISKFSNVTKRITRNLKINID